MSNVVHAHVEVVNFLLSQIRVFLAEIRYKAEEEISKVPVTILRLSLRVPIQKSSTHSLGFVKLFECRPISRQAFASHVDLNFCRRYRHAASTCMSDQGAHKIEYRTDLAAELLFEAREPPAPPPIVPATITKVSATISQVLPRKP